MDETFREPTVNQPELAAVLDESLPLLRDMIKRHDDLPVVRRDGAAWQQVRFKL